MSRDGSAASGTTIPAVERVFLVLAAADWLLAFGMTAAGVQRQAAVPLLALVPLWAPCSPRG